MGLSPEIFTIYWILKKENVPDYNNLTDEIKNAFQEYPYWKQSEQQTRDLKAKCIKVLFKKVGDLTKATNLIQKILKYLTLNQDE